MLKTRNKMINNCKTEITRWSFECIGRAYELVVYEDGTADVERLSDYLEAISGSPENRILQYCFHTDASAYHTPVTISTELFLILRDQARAQRPLDQASIDAITAKVLASTPGRKAPALIPLSPSTAA